MGIIKLRTQRSPLNRVEKIVNNEVKQAIALEITKRKMSYMAKEYPNIDLNADIWVDEFYTALKRVDEAKKTQKNFNHPFDLIH